MVNLVPQIVLRVIPASNLEISFIMHHRILQLATTTSQFLRLRVLLVCVALRITCRTTSYQLVTDASRCQPLISQFWSFTTMSVAASHPALLS